MKRPAYGEVLALWKVEGSLRDIYILHTDLADWQSFMDYVGSYSCSYSFDGKEIELPNVEQIFADREGSHLFRINLGEATANCHFFVVSEIELDLDPKEIKGLKAHNEVLSFIEGLADAVRKPVMLTPENGSEVPYLSYEPVRKMWHVHA